MTVSTDSDDPQQTAVLLLALLLSLESEERARTIYEERGSILDTRYLPDVYRATYMQRRVDGKPILPWLESDLEQRLRARGWILGTVVEKEYFPHPQKPKKEKRKRGNWFYKPTPKKHEANKPQRRLQVESAGHAYLPEPKQLGYRPAVGDLVLINTLTAFQNGPKTSIAVFLPATSAQEVRFR